MIGFALVFVVAGVLRAIFGRVGGAAMAGAALAVSWPGSSSARCLVPVRSL